MKSILELLYDGEIYLDELIVPKNSKSHEINQKITDALDTWKKKLSEDDFKQLEALLELRSCVDSMDATFSFVYGFKLGVVIMIEVLNGKEELAHGTGN